FGIEKGSMPGVDKTRKGKLEFAHGGTLYVENVEDLSSELQQKLLRYLQEKKYYRFGGAELLSHDVRVIAGTTANLEELANQGKFSRDLLVRINMLPFRTPSLREHPGDIPVLVSHFSDQIARESGSELKIFSEKALEAMKSYSWPGNVRELRNFVERVYILTPGEYIDLHDVRFAGLGEGAPDGLAEGTFREARARFEKEYLIKKIQENGGNISRTAEAIGLERSYLHRKIKSYGIEVN
ncbi:MAG: sigma 54-interacting transcriptional regulator, partial [Bdellovibrionaceae bacterium]|nr:sigma 54-interacting transcriptional regulator [Pseudobdellovibrionaceae bacterium]